MATPKRAVVVVTTVTGEVALVLNTEEGLYYEPIVFDDLPDYSGNTHDEVAEAMRVALETFLAETFGENLRWETAVTVAANQTLMVVTTNLPYELEQRVRRLAREGKPPALAFVMRAQLTRRGAKVNGLGFGPQTNLLTAKTKDL